MEIQCAGFPIVTTRPVQSFKDSQLGERVAQFASKYASALTSNKPLREKPRADCDKYRDSQEQVMKHWKGFFHDVVHKLQPDVDPDEIWLDLCRGGLTACKAMDYCKWFLEDYIAQSAREVWSDESDDMDIERSIKRNISVSAIWRTLVTAVDNTILYRKRQTVDGEEAHRWTLMYSDSQKKRGSGPVADISNWIKTDLTVEYDLVQEQTFKKVGATSVDALVLLRALWVSAKHIPCSRQDRVDFHKAFLVMRTGGFRPGCVVKLKYKQVEVDLVRHPGLPASTKMVPRVNITILQNKRKRSQAGKSQDEKVEFPVFPAKDPLVCLSTLLITQAIYDQAFATSTTSLDDLTRPRNDHYVKMRWKKEMLDREIIQIDYATFLRGFHRLVLVAGAREKIRPYALRVGAGADLDKALTSAQRNYVLSNSTSIFEKNYQPRAVNFDLMKITFGDHAGGDETEELLKLTHNMSFTWNKNAPIYPTQEDVASFEQKPRIRAYRAEYARLKDDPSPEAQKQANRVQSRISKSIDILCKLRVARRRKEFWEDSDGRNADGKRTDNMPNQHINPRKARHQDSMTAATQIGQILCQDEVGSTDFSNSLLNFLRCQDDSIATLCEGLESPQAPMPTCLLCKTTFTDRRNMIRHNVNKHQAQFEKPFDCPSCKNPFTIQGADDWYQHVFYFHGKQNAARWPLVKKEADTASKLLTCDRLAGSKHICCLCGHDYNSKKNLTRHNLETHHREGRFDELFDCPACSIINNEKREINNAAEWSSHVARVHGEHNAPALPKTNISFKRNRDGGKKSDNKPELEGKGANHDVQTVVPKKKRRPDKGQLEIYKGKKALCLLCGWITAPGRFFSTHLGKKHGKQFESPFSCPKCLESGREVRISCRFGWTCHVSKEHGGDNGAMLVDAGESNNGVGRCVKSDVEMPKQVEAVSGGKGALIEPGIPGTFIDPIL
ncbi:uncharacterized protein PpBr36_09678 [Pyricularia pennisetigena]|uniref:uncharacterized protein n=1 Tax=Pyricularia pennisetigena TaxID=1578925 RepID=UPI0011523A84|nr:uncharacterized protein PpBr36_09678 [Pyricularia pennisetigena]TLS22192.1 hypothetical protein PpBr36_09678 [Pyricularia pennisetigena]